MNLELTIKERSPFAFVTLNRPEKRNALTRTMLAELIEVFHDFGARHDLRAIILMGAGTEAFSAGTDIAELAPLDEAEARAAAERGQAACDAIELCGVPVIAAVNGAAVGGLPARKGHAAALAVETLHVALQRCDAQ